VRGDRGDGLVGLCAEKHKAGEKVGPSRLLLKWSKFNFRVLRKTDLKFSVGVQIVGNNLWNNRLILGTVVMSIVDLYKCLLHILMNFEEKRTFISFPVMN